MKYVKNWGNRSQFQALNYDKLESKFKMCGINLKINFYLIQTSNKEKGDFKFVHEKFFLPHFEKHCWQLFPQLSSERVLNVKNNVN